MAGTLSRIKTIETLALKYFDGVEISHLRSGHLCIKCRIGDVTRQLRASTSPRDSAKALLNVEGDMKRLKREIETK